MQRHREPGRPGSGRGHRSPARDGGPTALPRGRASARNGGVAPCPPPTRGPRARRASPARGFWFAAVALTISMAFGTAPAVLWPLYQARDGFGATTVTVAFAVLVVGAAFSFLTLGHLSDRLGRRRIIAAALLVTIAAAIVLLCRPDVPGLVLGRVLNGIGVGLMASTATTYLHDLFRQAHPGRAASPTPGVVATLGNLGGLALGPLTAGVIAQWLPAPLTTTQVVFAVALAISLVLVLSSPETVVAGGHRQDRPRRFALQDGGGAAFVSGAGLGFFAFALLGLVASLGAIMIRDVLGAGSPFVAGVVPFSMFASAAVAQLTIGRRAPDKMLTVGVVAFVAGLVLVSVSLRHPALWLFVIAVVVAGAGAGLLFSSGLTRSTAAAVPASRAGVLAVYFVIAYAGMGGPSILFSIVLRYTGMETVMTAFAIALAVGATLAVIGATRAAHRT
ncbi:MFS transporter [Actinomadura scrupuli]|uniref:MFS transporter n=1 Tax=Actinomadura scrupuli TaxID=559629 RepID=UPI003D972C54